MKKTKLLLMSLLLVGLVRMVESEELNTVATAKYVINKFGIKDGICIVINRDSNEISLALAKLTNLRVYEVAQKEKTINTNREKIDQSGFYGRVTVEYGNVTELPFPDFFANIVVCYESFEDWKEKKESIEEIYRIVRPGGVAVLLSKKISEQEKKEWEAVLKEIKYFQAKVIFEEGTFYIEIRHPKATFNWPMFCYDPANTFASEDKTIKPPLKLLWANRVRHHHNNFNLHPVVANDMVYSWHGDAVAFDAYTGETKWKSNEGLEGFFAINGEFLYGMKEDYSGLIALDAFTGIKKWFYKLEGDKMVYLGYPIVANGRVYFRTENGVIHCIDAKSGKQIWTCKVGKGCFAPAIAEGKVYTVGDEFVHCIDAKDGKVLWKKSAPRSTREPDSISFYKERLYLFTPLGASCNGCLSCVNAKDGEVVWENPSAGGSRWLCFYEDTVYTQRHGLVAYNIADGKERWRVMGAGCGPVMCANGLLLGTFTRSEKLGGAPFIIYDAKTGKFVWKDKSSNSYHSCVGAVVANGIVYVATRDGVLYAFSSDKKEGAK